IEIDGFAHDSARAAKADGARSHFLRSQGVATLRVPARIVLGELGAAAARIVGVCHQRPTRSSPARAGAPPTSSGPEGQVRLSAISMAGKLACAPPPSFGWSPSPDGGGISSPPLAAR